MAPSTKSPTPAKVKVETSFLNWFAGGSYTNLSASQTGRTRKVIMTDSKSLQIVETSEKKEEEKPAEKDTEKKADEKKKEGEKKEEEKKDDKKEKDGDRKEEKGDAVRT